MQSVITEALVKGDRVAIPGFLTLDVAERDARTVVRVSAGQALTRAVAGN